MGKKRVEKLFNCYQNLDEISKSTPLELAQKLSINKDTANRCISLAKDILN